MIKHITGALKSNTVQKIVEFARYSKGDIIIEVAGSQANAHSLRGMVQLAGKSGAISITYNHKDELIVNKICNLLLS